ncbi:alpha/beta fold hydrolase [Mycobacterium sp. 852002-51057_SCH5723018]|uniref:alpha/beta fold hydrolase n=1 Tax=Mycobacterium sp. 852002-51057_SCH5723018 TaxID=1834094 RepID=UPI0008011234|nr:alpha/beta hydrolase [Mycobacterium sp. 852002-51057_SCH5723018]OBG26490.1 alpha/beta hydrolase [Mycobacterium sp. 852002-51057_SCH5723018]
MSTAVSADGTVIGYETAGSGPALLLVHGSTGTHARWSSVREPLAQRYTVHAMDRRGRGLSTAEAGPYGLRREAEDVAAVAEAVGGDVYVVGHSYGALAVLEAALITPAFRRIVLYEPPMPSRGLDPVSADGWARLNAASDPREVLETFYRETLHLPEPAVKDLAEREFSVLAGSIGHTAARELAEVCAYRATERLAKITVPVRMLVGTESPAYLRTATAAVAAQIPGATIVALQGQGHQAIDYDPHQFVRAVLEFDAPEAHSMSGAASVPPSS